MKIIVFIVLLLIILSVLIILQNEVEGMALVQPIDINPTPKIFTIVKLGDVFQTSKFRFKDWSGADFEAEILGVYFQIRRKGSDVVNLVDTINILRFRSMQWQLSFLPEGKFLVFRFNGLTGMPMKTLDLVDWDDETYSIVL